MTTIVPAENTLYDLLKNGGCELDHWQSDLYVLATQQARLIIKDYQEAGHTAKSTVFRSKIDGRNWIDLPFHYTPYWTSRSTSASQALPALAPASAI